MGSQTPTVSPKIVGGEGATWKVPLVYPFLCFLLP